MNSAIRIAFVISILVASLAGCNRSSSAPQSTPMTTEKNATASFPSDVELTSSIERRLAADELTGNSDIRVRTEQGLVTLTGIAETEEAKQKAEAIASGTYGVKKVLNAISVGPINTNKPGGPRSTSR